MIPNKDRNILRELSRRLVDIADHPDMARRRSMWTAHNDLASTYPMIVASPEGSWRELLPPDAFRCENDWARRVERQMRMALYRFDHFRDDHPIDPGWAVGKRVHTTGWGLKPERVPKTKETGTWAFKPVILEPSDLAKLKQPELVFNEAATLNEMRLAEDAFGDILEVHLVGVKRVGYHMMKDYTDLRGLEQVFLDMLMEPEMLHDVMAFMEEGHHRIRRAMIDGGLFELNNDASYQNSGGTGYTTQLPANGFDGEVRPCDMWASAEAQELAPIGPEHHEEFCMQYERRLLAPFGLNGYGCCEDLAGKMDDVLRIPNIRRVSISPFSNVATCAEQLKGDVVFSWKPQPARLVGQFNEDLIRREIRDALETTKAHGCVVEMYLKDTHTCDNHPERFERWIDIARDEVERLYGPLPAV